MVNYILDTCEDEDFVKTLKKEKSKEYNYNNGNKIGCCIEFGRILYAYYNVVYEVLDSNNIINNVYTFEEDAISKSEELGGEFRKIDIMPRKSLEKFINEEGGKYDIEDDLRDIHSWFMKNGLSSIQNFADDENGKLIYPVAIGHELEREKPTITIVYNKWGVKEAIQKDCSEVEAGDNLVKSIWDGVVIEE